MVWFPHNVTYKLRRIFLEEFVQEEIFTVKSFQGKFLLFLVYHNSRFYLSNKFNHKLQKISKTSNLMPKWILKFSLIFVLWWVSMKILLQHFSIEFNNEKCPHTFRMERSDSLIAEEMAVAAIDRHRRVWISRGE